VRRQTLHQFVDAALVVANPDDPSRPVNSRKNVYQIDERAFALLRQVGTPQWDQLKALFAKSLAGLVYVSCFTSRAEMRKYLANIAWETEVWCAEDPTHLIHFNGERFLGPY